MHKSTVIRPIRIRDLLKLRKLFKKALIRDFAYFPGDYLEEVERENTLFKFLKAKQNKQRLLLGLFEGNRLIGYVIADVASPDDNFIFWLYVIDESRGSGYGKDLLNDVLSRMHKKGATVVKLMTHQLEDFYKSFGFDIFNENTDLFEGITMYEMKKVLQNETETT